jgi:hypothetical protein
MTISDTLAHKSLSKMTLFFFPIFALQLVLGIMVTIGLFHLGFWKTATLEICKLAFVVPKAFQFRRASLEDGTAVSAASLLATASAALLAISAFADAILISYDVQSGIGH